MTDEELAEEQIKKWDNILYPQMYPVTLVKDFIRKAFLAGLKAGRPEWYYPSRVNYLRQRRFSNVSEMSRYMNKQRKQIANAREIMLKLYNAGRDVLMCREQEEAYTRLDEAINDKSIEQFLKDESQSKWVNPARTTNDNQIKLSEVEK